jgi:hypothetical protein
MNELSRSNVRGLPIYSGERKTGEIVTGEEYAAVIDALFAAFSEGVDKRYDLPDAEVIHLVSTGSNEAGQTTTASVMRSSSGGWLSGELSVRVTDPAISEFRSLAGVSYIGRGGDRPIRGSHMNGSYGNYTDHVDAAELEGVKAFILNGSMRCKYPKS